MCATTVGVDIVWDINRLAQLKELYHAAVHAGQEEFAFGQYQMYTPYAGYLIEYLDTVLQPNTVH